MMRKTTIKQRLHAVHAAERKAARRKTHARRARLYGEELSNAARIRRDRRLAEMKGYGLPPHSTIDFGNGPMSLMKAIFGK